LEKYKAATTKLQQAIEAYEWRPGREHLHTLAVRGSPALTYGSQDDWNKKEAEKLGVMVDLLGRRGDYIEITEDGIIRIAKSFD
jgi:hypothetical protein